MNDSPAGLRDIDLVYAFPTGLNAVATWNKTLMPQQGEEFRTKGAHVFLGPAMAVTRAPEAGRQWVSFGVDCMTDRSMTTSYIFFPTPAYLTGEVVYATVVGVQSTGVQACAKHFIGNQQESFRCSESSIIDQRTLQEKYASPFQRAVRAGVMCVICSYSRISGTYACENAALIGETGLLKGQLGFKGYVVSDWGRTHGLAIGNTAAGLDIEMPGDWILIGGGVLCIVVDTMVTRMLIPYFRLGQDQGFPAINFNFQSSSSNSHVNARTTAHTALIRIIGGASAVLLKNLNNALPLVSPDNIGVVGLNAGPNVGCTLNACDAVRMLFRWGSGTNSLAYLVAPITAIQAQVNATVAAGHATTLVDLERSNR
ncbi:glycoside hydrolase family 3 protein [Hydnum rufescens UP504]|uniref:beta-glucosidase n=1 Tax=Hydnum rufescens UP504 TaxID=1448309 RepID=A0A9P6DY79_9AGAM|nr:glycoside hydrolase family 3 protein [Hydnum rufescens UP504]